MKRKLLFTLLGLAASVASIEAQTTIATNDFNEANGLNGWVVENNGTSPEEWQVGILFNPGTGLFTTVDNGNLFAFGFNTAAGALHDGNTTVTSTAFNTEGHDNVFLKLEHYFAFYATASAVGTIEVSNDSTNWDEVYVITTETNESEVLQVNLGATAANQATVYLRFTYVTEGDYFWAIDDLELFAPISSEAALEDITIPLYENFSNGPFDVTMVVKNNGAETITSINAEYTVDGGTPVSQNITGLNIVGLETAEVTFTTGFAPVAAGVYEIEATITEINGAADGNTADNVASKNSIIYDAATASNRVPLFEVFTSSSCAPCTPGNANYHSIVDSKPKDEYVSIKFQQNFPGNGDPYCTDEALTRRGYYGINSIPRMEIDGGWDGNANSFSGSLYNQALTVPAVFEVAGTYEIDEQAQSISYSLDLTPSFDMPAGTGTLYIAILENETDKNVSTNGETLFENVMKKMIPGADGEATPALVQGQKVTLTGTYVFQGNYRLPADGQPANRINNASEHSVEEFSDLHIVAWIQHEESKQVLQAGNLENANAVSVFELEKANIESLSVYPNPADEAFTASFEMATNANVDVKVINTAGQVVDARSITAKAGKVMVEFGATNLPSGVYQVQVEENGNVIATSKAVVAH